MATMTVTVGATAAAQAPRRSHPAVQRARCAKKAGDRRRHRLRRRRAPRTGLGSGGRAAITFEAPRAPRDDRTITQVHGENDGAVDATGRRRGPQVKGAVQLKDYVKYVRRASPTWGKRFGEVHKPRVGRFGAFTSDDAKLCLLTEDFGWKLGEDKHLAPTPPYVRLCYGELHGEQDSLRIFTGLSEIHLLKNLDLTEVHAMLQTLGYVSYCVPDGTAGVQPRWWGAGIDVHPQAVSAGLPGGKGPMFYSWHYRLPPWAPGLCLEGEDCDFANGPLALVKKRVNVHEEMEKQKVNGTSWGPSPSSRSTRRRPGRARPKKKPRPTRASSRRPFPRSRYVLPLSSIIYTLPSSLAGPVRLAVLAHVRRVLLAAALGL